VGLWRVGAHIRPRLSLLNKAEFRRHRCLTNSKSWHAFHIAQFIDVLVFVPIRTRLHFTPLTLVVVAEFPHRVFPLNRLNAKRAFKCGATVRLISAWRRIFSAREGVTLRCSKRCFS
jgi:hypothetical protein